MGVSAGRVLLIPKGDWNAETTYTGLDWVRHNGAAWVCKNTCTNVEPTEENSENWQIIARDGQSGSVINVDATMSDTSENPVQNKVIKKYVDDHTPEVDDMTGATATQNGSHGLVPAPKIGDENKALLGDGTWGSVVIDVDDAMSDTSVNPVQNKVVKKYVDDKQVNIDGITLTLDETRNVIKLADALKDKIGSALQPESIVNNQITTEGGFALDARQANPNIDGTLAKQISYLNGSLKLGVPIVTNFVHTEFEDKNPKYFADLHHGANIYFLLNDDGKYLIGFSLGENNNTFFGWQMLVCGFVKDVKVRNCAWQTEWSEWRTL